MRKISQQASYAFESGISYKNSNTAVVSFGGVTSLYLHGNKIAERKDGKLYISNCGWATTTTKERLNALQGVAINQKNFEWFLNGKAWNGEMIEVVATI
jgi:hypothetical protein